MGPEAAPYCALQDVSPLNPACSKGNAMSPESDTPARAIVKTAAPLVPRVRATIGAGGDAEPPRSAIPIRYRPIRRALGASPTRSG